MVYVKFTPVKLIKNSIPLVCLILLLSTEISLAKQKYSIQIAALKTPQNINDLADRFDIADSITVIKSNLWYRYLIGSFNSFEEASVFKNELFQKTKLKNAFVRKIDFEAELDSSIVKSDSASQSKNSEIKIDEIDSVQQNSVVVESINEGLSADSKIQKRTEKPKENNLLILFLGKNKVSALKNSCINYCNIHFPQEIRSFYIALIEISFQFPVIFLFVSLILLFVLNIICMILILDYSIKRKNKRERFIMIYSKMYESVLLSYMFGEINWETAIIKLKRKERKENRKILISILFNFNENFKGEINRLIPEIYIKLGLQKDSLKSVQSWFYHNKVNGIRELTYFYPEGAYEIVPKLINDANDNVRAEAQTSFVRLNPDNPFKFFETLTKPFTPWTQLTAFNLLRVNQLPVPSFVDFLDSKHVNIRNFSLRMIIYFQQLENVPEILKMLDSKIDQTRFLSYRAINDLRLYEGKEILKDRFRKETVKNKHEIIKAFRNIGSEEDFGFLETVISSESVSLKIEACFAIYYMNDSGRERLLKMKNEPNIDLELLIAHVTDLRN